MAANNTTKISLRFVFNRNARTLRSDWAPRTARVISREVAIQAAETVWKEVETKLKATIMLDAQREVSQIAQTYRRLIIGIGGGNTGARGTITSQASQAFGSTEPISSSFSVHWADRSANYIQRKLADVHHARWFEYGGGLGHGVQNPVNRQLQNAMGQAATWTRAFGPIGIRVSKKTLGLDDANYSDFLKHGVHGAPTDKIQLKVATVTVTAFGRITPEMLPVLASGGSDLRGSYPSDGRNTGLVGLLPSSIAYRLGGNRKYVPYRPTLEPFLEFFLVRSLPNAVMRRLQEGLTKNIRGEKEV